MPRTTASEYIQPNSSPYISHCCGGWKASQRLWNLHLRNQPSLPSTPFHREGAFRPFLLPTHISKQTNVLLPILLSRRAPTSVVPNICHLCDQRPPQTRRTQNDRCANYQWTGAFGTELHGSNCVSGRKVILSCSRDLERGASQFGTELHGDYVSGREVFPSYSRGVWGGASTTRDGASWQIRERIKDIPLLLEGVSRGCANYQRTRAFATELHGSKYVSGAKVFLSCSRGLVGGPSLFGTELHDSNCVSGIKVFHSCLRGAPGWAFKTNPRTQKKGLPANWDLRDGAAWQLLPEPNRGILLLLQGGGLSQ